MHDPKFEQEVQRKMEELVFTPSASVWTKVERGVNGEKRRRMPLVWWFLLPGLLLTGAGLLYFSHRSTPSPQQTNITYSTAPSGHTTTIDPAVANPAREGVDGSGNKSAGPHETQTAVAPPVVVRPVAASGRDVSRGTASRVVRPRADLSRVAVLQDGSVRPGVMSPAVTAPDETGKTSLETTGRTGVSDGAAARKALLRGPVPMRLSIPGVTAPQLPTLAHKSPAVQLTPAYKWEAGFAGGIGVSSLNEGLFRGTTVQAADYRASAAPITGSPHTSVSSIRPDLSYWAGIFLQRPLQQRLAVSFGLNLHYYSNRMKVGREITATSSLNVAQASSLFIGSITNAAAQPMAPYYAAGTEYDYTNRYYFLELPASLQWRFNHSKQMPLYWEGGFSLSYLVSSNGLYYNSKSGVYLKDVAVSNKTQFNLSTALMIGLPVRGVRLAVGPEVQYGLTSLFNTQATGAEHLFYGGIKIVLTPGKKK